MGSTTTMEWAGRPLGFGAALVRQFRLLWASRRPLWLLIGLLAVLMLGGEPWTTSPIARFFRLWPVWVILSGPAWAFTIWHNEAPSNRHYFWTQPVDRRQHALARIAAGLAWLWIMIAALTLFALLVAVFDGNAAQFGRMGTMAWVNLFSAPLLGYLGISALTVPSDHPARWFIGIVFLIPMSVGLLIGWLKLDPRRLEWMVAPLTHRDWGLGTAWTGPWAAATGNLGDFVRGMPEQHIEGFEHWWIAMPLWTLLALGVLALVARWHPDTMPRWRRSG